MCQSCGNFFHLATNTSGTGYDSTLGDDGTTPAEATGSVSYSPAAGEDWDSLLYVYRWSASTITYSFPTSASDYPASYPNGETATFQALNTVQMAAISDALSQVESFTGLTFSEVIETPSTGAVLRFAESDAPSTAWGYYPNPYESGGDVWFNPDDYNSPVIGNYAYGTVLHEIGHALGLMHGHDTGNPNGALAYEYDSEEFSLMTYRDHVGDAIDYSENETWGNSQSYMMFDIAALQYFYGANYATSGEAWSGDSVYTFSTTTGEMFINGAGQGTPGGNRIFRTVWDGDGNDTYDLSNYSTDLVIDLSPGGWSTFSSAQLADLDAGSRATNLARGNIANALLVGGDTRSLVENAIGGAGNDLLVGNQAANELEGGDGADQLYGGSADDTLEGGDGSDLLDGGTGADIIRGGSGFDTVRYFDSAAGVTVNLTTQTVSGGDAEGDTISSIEAVNGSATGGDTLIGSADGNQLFGFGGNDLLLGEGGGDGLYGGDGDDHLYGGEGNDILEGGDGNDLLDGGTFADVLNGGAGFDTIRYADSLAGVTVNLTTQTVSGGDAEGDTISGIEAVNGSATGGDTLIGSADGNQLFGFGGNDLLLGEGGGDGLYGGDGDDHLYGGAESDILEGGAGNDLLDGGTFADVLNGGAGFDTIRYADSLAGVTVNLTTQTVSGGDAEGDTISGIEAVNGSATGGDTLTGSAEGNQLFGFGGDDNLLGEGGGDGLYGGDGNDTITGGTGNDILEGGADTDTFVFAEFGSANADTINDYSLTDSDVVRLIGSAFGLAAMTVSSSLTAVFQDDGINTQDEDDFLVWSTTEHILYFDADANGTGAGEEIASFSGSPTSFLIEIV